jgi:hypothetical protein
MRRIKIMKNEKGEVVIGVMVALMVIMMISGMGLGHRGNGGSRGHCMTNGHSEKGLQHAHDGSIDKPAQTAGEKADEVIAVAK